MNKRLFLLVIVFVMVGGGIFVCLKPNPKKDMEKALDHVQHHRYAEAEALLASHPLPIYTPLYRGYIEQMRGRFEVSDRHLNVAFKEAKRSDNSELIAEISLARAVNAYCLGSDTAFYTHIATARAASPDSLSLSFFEGLELYLSHAYTDALRLWGISSNEARTCDGWMNTSLDSLFNPSWRKLHAAHCLIEEGDLVSSREIIEKESRQSSSEQETLPLATLFLGLSYLKEAQKASLDQRGSYYKLARFYFERAKTHHRFFREKEQVTGVIEQETDQLLLAHQNSEQRKWGFDFIHTLQDWKADAAIERLAEHLAEKLLLQKREESIHLCVAIREEFHGSPFHLRLTEKMLATLTQEVKGGEAEDLFGLWALVEQLAPSPALAAKKIASLTSDEIFETIKKDNLSLARTRNFLAFWEKLGRSTAEREMLARDLLIHSKHFWYSEQQEKKGQNLMAIALHISNHNSFVEKEISSFLTTLYKQAEGSNMIGRLLLVYDAMGQFEINRQELVSKAALANHLADAEYLYKSHNYVAAKTHAGWVLKLDPQSEGALRLVGLASFQMGEYGQALVHLRQLSNPDEDINKALMLSQVFATQEQVKHLCQTDPSDTYEENE